MIVKRLYAFLCRLYNIHSQIDISSYLLKAPPAPAMNTTSIVGNRRHHREALFIVHRNDTVELGLYLHPTLLHRLEGEQGAVFKTGGQGVDDFACVVEGVSHFLYLVDRIERDRRCSQLELELQAEVDKFLALHMMAIESEGTVDPNLFSQMFVSASYDPHLNNEELDRYQTASHFAAKYCSHLRSTCFFPYRPTDLVTKVRPFFYKNLQGKLHDLTP